MAKKSPFSHPDSKDALQVLGKRVSDSASPDLPEDAVLFVQLAYNKDGRLLGCGYMLADAQTDDTVPGKSQNAPTSLRSQ